jgi:hypothetical protein
MTPMMAPDIAMSLSQTPFDTDGSRMSSINLAAPALNEIDEMIADPGMGMKRNAIPALIT